MKTTDAALLVIDVQIGCFSQPGAPISQAERFVSQVALLVARAREHGIPIVYTQQISPPGHLFALGSKAVEIRPEVASLPDDLVVQKTHSDAFLGTDLHDRLQEFGTETLVVCGLQTEFCVDTTCRRAHGLGYTVVLAQDAHATADSASLTAEQIVAHHNETLGRAYVRLVSVRDVFAS